MDKRFSLSITISTAIHALLLFLALHLSGDGNGGNGKKGGGDSKTGSQYEGVQVGEILAKERPVEVEMIEIPPEKPELIVKKEKPKKAINADEECPGKWYGGIGIRESRSLVTGEDTIENVYPGYPADLAGLLVGDVILGIDQEMIIGPPGTPLKMWIKRNGAKIEVNLIRGKVCY